MCSLDLLHYLLCNLRNFRGRGRISKSVICSHNNSIILSRKKGFLKRNKIGIIRLHLLIEEGKKKVLEVFLHIKIILKYLLKNKPCLLKRISIIPLLLQLLTKKLFIINNFNKKKKVNLKDKLFINNLLLLKLHPIKRINHHPLLLNLFMINQWKKNQELFIDHHLVPDNNLLLHLLLKRNIHSLLHLILKNLVLLHLLLIWQSIKLKKVNLKKGISSHLLQ